MENWKDIPGFEGLYAASENGKIKSVDKICVSGNNSSRFIPAKTISTHLDKDGYAIVRLCKLGVRKRYKVHRLVAMTFLENIKNKPQVNHKNGIKNDNRVHNLEWASVKENVVHSYRTGLKFGLKGADHPNSKLVLNLETGIYYESVAEACNAIGMRISISNLYNQLSGYSGNKTSYIYV